MRRVVITGMGIISPIGNTPEKALDSLLKGTSGVDYIPEWDDLKLLRPRVGAAVEDFELEQLPRKVRRTMGRVGGLAAESTRLAVEDAGIDPAWLSSGEVGVSFGSTMGSLERLAYYYGHLGSKGELGEYRATSFLQVMSHTCAANIAQIHSVRGRMIAPCSACTSGSQSIGFAAEAIRYGKLNGAIAGGADELHFISAATFDVMHGASYNFNDSPKLTPRPFDAERDGLVVGEGSGTLILEEMEHAEARGARIYGEILGYGTNCDGTHMTAPSSDGMKGAMELALSDAGIKSGDIDYINAHATATIRGDIAEATAVRALFKDSVPVSSTKSLTGHTLGACGAIETIFCLMLAREGRVVPTYNLKETDPECGGIYHPDGVEKKDIRVFMNNNFAFGGVNSSIIIGL